MSFLLFDATLLLGSPKKKVFYVSRLLSLSFLFLNRTFYLFKKELFPPRDFNGSVLTVENNLETTEEINT